MTLLSLPEGLNLLDRRTRFARIALLAYIFVSALDILVAMGQFTGAIDNEDMSLPTAGALTIIFLLYLLIFAATVVLVAMWVYRAHANLRAAGIDDLAFTPGWAVGWYFVPVATFVQPFKAMRELWSVSLGQHESFGDDADPQIKLWWGTWLAGNIIAYVGMRDTFTSTPAGIQVGLLVSMLSTALLMASAWLLAQIMAEINAAQRDGIPVAQAFA